MSQETLSQLAERARTDEAFQEQLRANPERVLAGYDLTAEEREALLGAARASGDLELSDEQLNQVAGGFTIKQTVTADDIGA